MFSRPALYALAVAGRGGTEVTLSLADALARQGQRVLVIDCSPATQVCRVVARSGLAATDVEAIIAAQASRPRRLASADLVLTNDGISLQELAAQVAQIGRQFGL